MASYKQRKADAQRLSDRHEFMPAKRSKPLPKLRGGTPEGMRSAALTLRLKKVKVSLAPIKFTDGREGT